MIELILLIYALLLIGPYIVSRNSKSDNRPIDLINIIVPYRNESHYLATFCESLKISLQKVSIPCEIYFIDDHSDDDSTTIIQSCFSAKNVHFIVNQSQGKKEALSQVFNLIKNGAVIQLDADLELDKNCIFNHLEALENGSYYNSGIVKYNENNTGFINAFQILENVALMGLTRNTFMINAPLMSNAGNSSFVLDEEIDLNKSFASGDDVFNLYSHVSKGRKVEFVSSKVSCEPVFTWREMFQQRIRWISKTNGVKNWKYQFLGILFIVVNVIQLIATLMMFENAIFFNYLIVKCFTDLIFLMLTNKVIGYNKKWLVFFPFVYIIYPFYIFILILSKPFVRLNWKGRRVV